MEIARVLGSMVKSGWRPRRTIVFASWAVEEYGLEGSYEYVYDNINKITNRYIVEHVFSQTPMHGAMDKILRLSTFSNDFELFVAHMQAG